MSDKDSNLGGRFDRRTVLKTLGAGTAVSGLSMVGSASAQLSVPEGDIELTGATGVNPDAVEEDVQAILSKSETNTLSTQIKDETGFELYNEFAVGIDLETDDEELNDHNPRVVYLPLKPSTDRGGPTPHEKPSVSEFSPDNGGTILAATVQHEGNRMVAGLMGMTREESQRGRVGPHAKKTVDTKSFVVEDSSAKVHQKSTGDQPIKADLQAEFRNNGPIATAPDFTCWGCATVVGIACAGAIKLSMGTCASAALSSSLFSPWAGGAVSAFCLYIVSNAGTLSCAAGTAAICSSVTNDCDFLED